MAKKRTKKEKNITVETYSHKGKKRKNNPPVGLVSSATDKLNGITDYKHDPHIDPCLSWAGKVENIDVSVRNVSLHVHERNDPDKIIKSFLKKESQIGRQLTFFEEPENELPLNKAIDFYRHEQDWTNRLIAGDSLLVMNSLLKKEGMAGKVQMIYVDPPYGVKFNSNFQPFVNKRDVTDANDADIPAEPEMIQAFRDTWELGIHSYLTYLRDRLLLAKEMLHENGSIFLQINDENVHITRCVVDEVFGRENFVSQINFQTTSYFPTKTLATLGDYIIWYAKDKNKVKVRRLYEEKYPRLGEGNSKWLLFADGTYRGVSAEEKRSQILPEDAIPYTPKDIKSQGASSSPQPFEYEGKTYSPGLNHHWKANYPEGMKRIAKANRIHKAKNSIQFRRFHNDFSFQEIGNYWTDTIMGSFTDEKIYAVQTNVKVISRCMLLCTDPGDLVFDPTCGSGTTAYCAEQWGRRWITCDTSRVAITLAKQRLMTVKFDYYQLAHPAEGIRSGFKYKTVPHITLASIAKNEPAKVEPLYDQPYVESDKVRVTGPFTVEAVPSLNVKPFDGRKLKVLGTGGQLSRTGETNKQSQWRDELKATGIRTTGNKIITFSRIDPMAATSFIHAEAEILEDDGTNKKAYISFGPDYGPLEQRQVEEAINEARDLKEKPDFVIFAAFHFDPEAAKDIDQINWSGVKLLKAQMSVDLLTSDLRKKRSSSQSYWLIGQPDVEVIKHKNAKYSVIVNGFDYYDPISGAIISKGNKHIAMWSLDTDYDERSLFPVQVFFPSSSKKRDWSRLAKALNSKVDEDCLEAFSGTESLPFEAGEQKKVAVKIVDNRGIESFVIKNLE